MVPFHIVGDQCVYGSWFPRGDPRWVNVSLFRVKSSRCGHHVDQNLVYEVWIAIAYEPQMRVPWPSLLKLSFTTLPAVHSVYPHWAPGDSATCRLFCPDCPPLPLVLGVAAPTHIIQISVHMSPPPAFSERPTFSVTCPYFIFFKALNILFIHHRLACVSPYQKEDT